MKSVRYLLLFLSLFFLASCKEEKPISEDTEKEPEIIEEHVHDLIHHEALEPTCTKSGHNEYDECRTCDYSTLTIIPPLGHSYDSGVVTKEASCTEEGIITYTCTMCGDTYTETIKKLEHEYELVEVIEPTYEVEGKKIYRCKVCGDEYYEVIEKRDYLSLCEVLGVDVFDNNFENIIKICDFNMVFTIESKELIKLFFEQLKFSFQESDDYISDNGHFPMNEIIIYTRYEGVHHDKYLYFYSDGTIAYFDNENSPKYYYSFNSYDDFVYIREVFHLLSFMNENPDYEFKPYIELKEGKKYSYFEVISYVLSSPSILTLEDATLFIYGGNGVFTEEDIAQMYEFLEGEYEIAFDDRYYIDHRNESKKTAGLGFGFDYSTRWKKNYDLMYKSRYGFINIIDDNDFGETLLLYINGQFRFVTVKGCFTLSDLDLISESFNKLYDEECKEAEENGMHPLTYWTKKYNENHNN